MHLQRLLTAPQEKDVQIQKMYDKQFTQIEIENVLSNFGVTKKAKGVQTSEITFDSIISNSIRIENHDVYIAEQNKLALNPHDNKRMVN